MRHRVAHRKLGRVSEHRISMLRNQAGALLRHERISTTVAKAKELRPFVERLITMAKRGIADGTESGRIVHARRLVRRDIADREVATKLFETIAPRFEDRQGGYTRLIRVGFRQGDSSEMAQVELIGSEFNPETETPDDNAEGQSSSKPGGGVGGRIRRAAQRIRGGAKAADDRSGASGGRADRKGSKATPKRTRKKV